MFLLFYLMFCMLIKFFKFLQLYRSLNFRVALIGMEVWTKRDKMVVSSNAGVTLDNFLSWRKSDLLRKKMHDNAQLIT